MGGGALAPTWPCSISLGSQSPGLGWVVRTEYHQGKIYSSQAWSPPAHSIRCHQGIPLPEASSSSYSPSSGERSLVVTPRETFSHSVDMHFIVGMWSLLCLAPMTLHCRGVVSCLPGPDDLEFLKANLGLSGPYSSCLGERQAQTGASCSLQLAGRAQALESDSLASDCAFVT